MFDCLQKARPLLTTLSLNFLVGLQPGFLLTTLLGDPFSGLPPFL